MAKGFVFVVLYSIVLLTLFCVFCYLMTTVNPKPINSENDTAQLIEDFLPSVGEEILSYGLEKYNSIRGDDDDDQQPVTTEKSYVHLVQHNVTKVSEPFSTSGHLDLNISTTKTTEEIVDSVKETMGNKKGKRRSVSENLYPKAEQHGVVLLKIVDDTGNTKIEIKVEPDALTANDITYHENYKNKLESKNADTVIEILPNNTLSLAKPDSALVIDFARNNTFISKEVTVRKPDVETHSNTTPSIILQTLKNNSFVLFSATNSSERYVTKSQ